MNCVNCTSKACKTEARDCRGTRDEIAYAYIDPEKQQIYQNADNLVSRGRAGTLSRLEEVAEFALAQGYKKVALAYCYGMENLAMDVAAYLKERGLKVGSYRCTLNGITEKEIHPELGDGIGCNPLGQAEAINTDPVDFVIEMGLCLGHDVIFHQALKKPFTVLIVKDRVYNHNPGRALPSYKE